jgi:hypothetical protein
LHSSNNKNTTHTQGFAISESARTPKGLLKNNNDLHQPLLFQDIFNDESKEEAVPLLGVSNGESKREGAPVDTRIDIHHEQTVLSLWKKKSLELKRGIILVERAIRKRHLPIQISMLIIMAVMPVILALRESHYKELKSNADEVSLLLQGQINNMTDAINTLRENYFVALNAYNTWNKRGTPENAMIEKAYNAYKYDRREMWIVTDYYSRSCESYAGCLIHMLLLCRDNVLNRLPRYKEVLSTFCDAYYPLHDRLISTNFSFSRAEQERSDIQENILSLYTDCDEWLYGSLEGSTAYYFVMLVLGEISPLGFIGLTLLTYMLTNCFASPKLCCNPPEEAYTELSKIGEQNNVEVQQTNYPAVLSTFKQKLIPADEEFLKRESQHAFYMATRENPKKRPPISLLFFDPLASSLLPRIIFDTAGLSTDPEKMDSILLPDKISMNRDTFEASTSWVSFFKELKKQDPNPNQNFNSYSEKENILEEIYEFADFLPKVIRS